MKIKTIGKKIVDANRFDEEVNAALDEGWDLVRRTVIVPQGDYGYLTLYAELVKDLETENTFTWQDAVQTLMETCRNAKTCEAGGCPMFDWCEAHLAEAKEPQEWSDPDE